MARQYAQIKIAIWSDDDYRALTMPEQWLYEALLSQPDLSLCGLIILRPRRWARLCAGIDADTVETILRQLETKRYVLVDWVTEEVLIRTFVKHDGGGNHPKFRKGVEAAINRVESPRLKTRAQHALDVLTGAIDDDPIADAIADRTAIDCQSNADRSPTPQPVTCLLSPVTEDPNHADESETTPGESPQDEGGDISSKRRTEVLDIYVASEYAKAKQMGTNIVQESAWRRKVRATGADHPDLDRWLVMFPDAPSSAVAGWLAGDKHSMAYYTRVDTDTDEPLAPVLHLRSEAG